MKKYILTTVLISFLSLYVNAQVAYSVNLGVGLSTPQILKDKPYKSQTNAGVLTPTFGIYPQARWKNFVLETGLESSQTKTSSETRSNYDQTQSINTNSATISRLSIPITLGYTIKIKNISVIPMIGLIRNINNKVNTSMTNTYSVDGVRNSNRIANPNHYYADPDELNKNRFLARIDINLTDRISLGSSVIFRKSARNNYIDCCFGDCYYGYYGGIDYKRDYRVFATYRL